MPSLEILEGLIGTGCAVACLYYARLGAVAGPQNSVPLNVPWHSALGEYARRNPFAAVFGALAFGFLASSWSMYIAPRAIALPSPRVIEKWHVVTKNVATADPAQTARIASLQTTINADTATIASQQTEIARLKHLLGRPATRAARPAATEPANEAAATGTGNNPPVSQTPTANPNAAAAPSTQPAAPAATPYTTPPSPAGDVPH
ncbi:MAG TPA: hypothetical protein VF835_06835 [Rhizomicrobium sp.]